MMDIPGNISDRELAVGRAVRRWRIDAGYTQMDVAERAGLSRSAVQSLETGAGSRLDTLLRILRALHREDALDSFALDTSPTPLDLLAAERRAQRERSEAPRVSRAARGEH